MELLTTSGNNPAASTAWRRVMSLTSATTTEGARRALPAFSTTLSSRSGIQQFCRVAISILFPNLLCRVIPAEAIKTTSPLVQLLTVTLTYGGSYQRTATPTATYFLSRTPCPPPSSSRASEFANNTLLLNSPTISEGILSRLL
eukprot:g7110.t1